MEYLKNLVSRLEGYFCPASGVSRTQRVLSQFNAMRADLKLGLGEIAEEQADIEDRIQNYRDKIVRLDETRMTLSGEVVKARNLSDGLAKLMGNTGEEE